MRSLHLEVITMDNLVWETQYQVGVSTGLKIALVLEAKSPHHHKNVFQVIESNGI